LRAEILCRAAGSMKGFVSTIDIRRHSTLNTPNDKMVILKMMSFEQLKKKPGNYIILISIIGEWGIIRYPVIQ
ncbi:YqhA family protein, partial [Chloroflexota bacterium]